MKVTELAPQIQVLLERITNWDTAIRDNVAAILDKLWKKEELTRSELGLNVTTSEVAAIWSIVNNTSISPDYVRQVKRAGRITPSEEWGKGSGYRCHYRVRDIKNIQVGHKRGRPRKMPKSTQLSTI
jgi:hypothetical protein